MINIEDFVTTAHPLSLYFWDDGQGPSKFIVIINCCKMRLVVMGNQTLVTLPTELVGTLNSSLFLILLYNKLSNPFSFLIFSLFFFG